MSLLSRGWLPATVLVWLVLTSACSTTASPAAQTATTAAGGGAAIKEPVAGEAATVRFVHPSAHWRIDSPGPMTARPDGSATYQGSGEFLIVSVMPGSTNAASVASTEAAAPTGPGYQTVRSPHQVTAVAGPAPVYEYRADGPANAVTGKSTVLRAVRMYVAGSGGVYRVEFGSTRAASTWDPQGAVDTVTTFALGA